jgi:hypothetical protein
LIADSALAAQAYTGYLDHATGDSFWEPPKHQRTLYELDSERGFGGPADAVARGLEELLRHTRDMPAGTFLFVISDFLAPPSRDLWLRVLARRWDVIPVVVQDPAWEQSFPAVGGIVLPFADPASRKRAYAELSHREAGGRRRANEARRSDLLRTLRGLDLDPVLVDRSDLRSVFASFVAWLDRRRSLRGQAW